ncbi:MAG: class I SAM-dependent methyltransferase [Nanoarchaeota archaeon]|nr:class I SAM-dependent methyltransferase [Nanoarchaeota archaeon]
MSKEFDMELAELWEACSDKLRNKIVLVNRLEELLVAHGITEKSTILDVAGGFGFPSIDLARRGYQIVYSDGSPGMLQKAIQNADSVQGIGPLFSFQSIGYSFVPWQKYAEFYGSDVWDALICMGNSLPYAASWGQENPDLKKSRELIKETLNQFHRMLTKNGILYVDKQPEAQDQAVEEVGEVEVDGKKLFMTCSFDNDKVNRIRNLTFITRDLKTGQEKQYPSHGYLLLEDELIPLLHEVGFKDVQKHVLEGEIYEGFIAKK